MGNKEVLSPNVVELSERFNIISSWIATEILVLQIPKKQGHLIEKFIKTANYCASIHNYNTLMEILSALNNSSISRLKKAWKFVSGDLQKQFYTLDTLMEARGNYRNYRTELKQAYKQKKFVLPYVGIFLRDLTFITEGNPLYIVKKGSDGGEKMNKEILSLIYDCILGLKKCQQSPLLDFFHEFNEIQKREN